MSDKFRNLTKEAPQVRIAPSIMKELRLLDGRNISLTFLLLFQDIE